MPSQVAAKQTLLVGTVKGVDKRVQAFASGAVRNVLASKDTGNLRGKLGSVLVESKVAVSGVMGVDEGVEVRVNRLILHQFCWESGSWSGSWCGSGCGSWCGSWCRSWCGSWGRDELSGLTRLDRDRLWFLRYKWGSILSSRWNVGAIQDPETIQSSRVLDSIGFSILSDVGVLTNTVSSSIRLFPEDDLILSGKSGSGAAISSIEPLLLQDLGILFLKDLSHGSCHSSRQNNLEEVSESPKVSIEIPQNIYIPFLYEAASSWKIFSLGKLISRKYFPRENIFQKANSLGKKFSENKFPSEKNFQEEVAS